MKYWKFEPFVFLYILIAGVLGFILSLAGAPAHGLLVLGLAIGLHTYSKKLVDREDSAEIRRELADLLKELDLRGRR